LNVSVWTTTNNKKERERERERELTCSISASMILTSMATVDSCTEIIRRVLAIALEF
jgi:hypothetical protein